MPGGPTDFRTLHEIKTTYGAKGAFVYQHATPEEWRALAGTIDTYHVVLRKRMTTPLGTPQTRRLHLVPRAEESRP